MARGDRGCQPVLRRMPRWRGRRSLTSRTRTEKPVDLTSTYISPALWRYLAVKSNLGDSPNADSILRTRTNECLKFLCLVHHWGGGIPIPVSAEIDDIWHFLILETREYSALCTRLPGGIFIHHQSTVFQPAAPQTRAQALSWMASYSLNFGAFTHESIEYWPMAAQLLHEIERNGGGLAELNQLLTVMSATQLRAHPRSQG